MDRKNVLAEILGGKHTDLLKFTKQYCHGSSPSTIGAQCEIVGLCDYGKYPYLPHLEFNITIGRALETGDIGSFPNEPRYFEERGLEPPPHDKAGQCFQLYEPNGQPYALLFLKDRIDFFEMLDGLKSENKRYPFEVMRRYDSVPHRIDLVKPEMKITFRVSATSYGQLAGETKELCFAEDVMIDFLDALSEKFDAYRELESLYTHEDADGKRLWIDQGSQSKLYYETANKLHEQLFSKIEWLFQEYRLETFKSYGLSGWFNNFRVIKQENGLIPTILLAGQDVCRRITSKFRKAKTA